MEKQNPLMVINGYMQKVIINNSQRVREISHSHEVLQGFGRQTKQGERNI